jgi:hypothetical protein
LQQLCSAAVLIDSIKLRCLRMSDSTNVLSKRRFGAVSIWVALGSFIISFGTTLLLFWVAASWIERPFDFNSPHADVVLRLGAGIYYFERIAYLIGFCLGVAATFRRGDRRWVGFFGACLNVLLPFAHVFVR